MKRRNLLAWFAARLGGLAASSAAPTPVLPEPIAPTYSRTALEEPNLRFGSALLQTLASAQPGENLFISPLSLSLALSMALNGAAGATREAMAKTLAVEGMPLDTLNSEQSALLNILQQDRAVDKAGSVALHIANALWADESFAFLPAYQQRMQTVYRAEARSLHLATAAPLINAWASEHTMGKIREIVQPNNLADAIAVLTNAVYFKGAWSSPFKPEQTTDGPFHLASGEVKTLPLMHQTLHCGYWNQNGQVTVRLNCGPLAAASQRHATGVSVYFILPPEKRSLAEVIAKMDARAWNIATGSMPLQEVRLTLPRFKIDYFAGLVEPLSAMGMGIAFSPQADFRNLGRFSDEGSGSGFITNVLHKAILEINEQGAVAAAVTALLLGRSAKRPSAPVTVVFDRPFLIAIRDDATGAPLFLGAVYDPDRL